MASEEIVEKLEKHLKLLKEEYTKLQRNYAELERKYSKAVASSGENDVGEFSSFISRLTMTVASLYSKKTYSDIAVRFGEKSLPAHRFVLSARSEEWGEEVLEGVNELDWSDLEGEVASALLRWIYTDVVDLQSDALALSLLRAAHRFKLPGLLGLCERALVSSVGVRSCVRFYCVAEEVEASSLLEYCSGLISTHWDDLTPQDFEHMSSILLYKMLESKTKNPLHAAIRLLREDVVFICLVKNDGMLSEVVNSLSPEGQLPLGLALMGRSSSIAQTLIESGKADVNAVNGDGCTLLIDAVKRGDGFSALFLLEKGANVNLTSKVMGDTALHIVVTYARKSTDEDTFEEMLKVGQKILECEPNVNAQNTRGYTPLQMAIVSGHEEMIEALLENVDVNLNLRTNDEKSALQLALQSDLSPDIAKNFIAKGADANVRYKESGNDLLQVLVVAQMEVAAIFLADYANLNHVNKSGLTALHMACQRNMTKLVRKLLDGGADPNCQGTEMRTTLHFAVVENNLSIIEAFVEHKNIVDFNLKDSKGDSPLSLALALGKKDLVPKLIEGGADVNARNGQDLTLLHQAILKEDDKTAIFLLSQGADMNALTGEQESPLQLAIHCSLPTVVDALCTRGVSLSAPDGKGESPLWSALEMEKYNIAEVLVRHGVDTDCWGPGPDGCLQTLLHRAIDENKDDAAIFLIKSRCDVDTPRQPGADGQGGDEARDKASPLHLCSQWGLVNVLQTLIDHGANVNALDCNSKTALHVAIENQHDEMIGILLCHPSIDLRQRDKVGNTPFAAALTVRNHKAAQNILQRLPNAAEQIDQRGRNFLHVAIMKDDLESVLFLLAIRVDVNSRVHDVNQTPPLHLAASSENEMLVRNLILAGARVNERDATAKTALHVAAERGRVANVSAILQNGADYDAVDGDGNNALHIAVREGHLSIVRELLTESGINAEAVNNKGFNPMLELCRTGKDTTAATICELFLECMPKYPINQTDFQGNTPLLLAFMRGQAPMCKVLVKNGACLGTENKDGVNIFNFQLATNQLLHKLLDQLPQESPWAASDVCQECGEKFSFTTRKHHCRHCGRNLCSRCSNNDVPIIKFSINKPVRVCAVCFEVLQIGSG
uniref:Ankyrin n=1 Tax=Nyssomyia neivai TaxID=330878 RepID=A0A1L8DIW4_9DIPT